MFCVANDAEEVIKLAHEYNDGHCFVYFDQLKLDLTVVFDFEDVETAHKYFEFDSEDECSVDALYSFMAVYCNSKVKSANLDFGTTTNSSYGGSTNTYANVYKYIATS